MVKEECVKEAKELLEYANDMETLWQSITNLERGRGDIYDLSRNIEYFIKTTHSGPFGDHRTEIITNLEYIKKALNSGYIKEAKTKMEKLITDYPGIFVDLIAECECGEFLVKTK